MDELEKALPAAEPAKPTQKQGKLYETDSKDRRFLLLTLGLCVLVADTLLLNQLGAGIAVTVAAWELLAIGYLGWACLKSGESRFLLTVNLLLGLTFALTSNWYFKLWNLGALAVLLPVQALALSGEGNRRWWQGSMLTERLGLFFIGMVSNWGAVGAALTVGKPEKSGRRWAVAVGAAVAAAVVVVIGGILISADALFASVTAGISDFFSVHFSDGVVRILWGLALTPFAFSLLYGLRRPRQTAKKPVGAGSAEPVIFLILLGALDGLYLLFLAVQATGLFGGAAFLESRGISYSDWARSGFFQMVGVTAVNLTVILAALRWSGREKAGWGGLKPLATALVAESYLLLCSAVWKMTLYVGACGLSFKRCMTYWGMAMMAVFLTAALVCVWRPKFQFCRIAFVAAVLGWMLVNCVPVDYLVARDNVERYLDGRGSVDITYLAGQLSYDTLGALEPLDGGLLLDRYDGEGRQLTLEKTVAQRRAEARAECAKWESWNLSACLAGYFGGI